VTIHYRANPQALLALRLLLGDRTILDLTRYVFDVEGTNSEHSKSGTTTKVRGLDTLRC
jgi:hypothetical protein